MEKFKENLNKLNGLIIRHSDMTYEMKNRVTGIIKDVLEVESANKSKVSKLITEQLNAAFPTGWICIIGLNFLANISHEPRTFLRASNDHFIFLIYKSIS
jgi:hypothetical protein